eukprot:scpid16224/ scgid19497/ 
MLHAKVQLTVSGSCTHLLLYEAIFEQLIFHLDMKANVTLLALFFILTITPISVRPVLSAQSHGRTVLHHVMPQDVTSSDTSSLFMRADGRHWYRIRVPSDLSQALNEDIEYHSQEEEDDQELPMA